MDNLHHLCIGFDNWTQVGFDSEDPKFSFGARQLEKGAGYALNHAFQRKVRGAGEACQQQGVAFLPMVVESFGGWHEGAVREVRWTASLGWRRRRQ